MAVLAFITLLIVFCIFLYFAFSERRSLSTVSRSQEQGTLSSMTESAAHKKLAALDSIMRSKHSDVTDTVLEYSIVGESKYQTELSDICGGYLKSKETHAEEATINIEPDNPFDKNAVVVKIKGKTVGYIPREDTGAFINLIHGSNGGVSCPVEIRGGWKRRDGSQAAFGVFLQIKVGV